jgi:DNA-binding NarL/FixJ family response regulator
MVAIAIFSTNPAMRRSLEQLLREDSTFSIVGVVDDPAAIPLLIDQNHVNVVLADAPAREQLADWRTRHNQTAFVIFVDGADEEGSLDALCAGARAILPRTAKPDEIFTAIKAVTNGLAVLPGELLPTLLSGASLVGELLDDNDADRTRLTPRELEVRSMRPLAGREIESERGDFPAGEPFDPVLRNGKIVKPDYGLKMMRSFQFDLAKRGFRLDTRDGGI